MTPKLQIQFLAHQGAPESVFLDGQKRLEKLLPSEKYTLTENNSDVLFFLTGGSERFAKQQVSAGRFVLLIGSERDNAYASATEVKAYLNMMKIPSLLLDEDEAGTPKALQNFARVKQALAAMQGKKIGLIGQVSDWLISSSISTSLLEAKLGIKLITIPWEDLAHFSAFKPSGQFLGYYSDVKNIDLTETAKISELLTDAMKKFQLDAITVECFPLVQRHGVTACLPLAKLNDEGIPAGCEGDITAIIGMILGKELTGTVPWIANVNKVTNEGCLFSHCTIAPGLVSDYSVTTHFETGKGTAIAGNFKGDTVTIFRFDQELRKAFLATATITERPASPHACRTQIRVNLTEREVQLLRDHPLGNHHLIVPGDCKEILHMACLHLGIEVLR